MGSQGKSSARAEPCPWLIQLPHFQYKEIIERRKRQDRLGPGTYNIKDFLQETRPASIRGICDTRDERFRGAHRQKQKKGPEVVTVTVRSFLDELVSNKNKTKGCFSTLPRDPGCPTGRIFWFTLSQCQRKNVMGPGSYNPKPIEKSACNSQAPSWSTAKRFNRNFYHLFTGNENTVGAGRYDTSKHEKYPQKIPVPVPV
ncbi:ciliary microtubule-associated protein 2 [Ara ararauna]